MNGQVALYQFIASFALLYPSAISEGLPASELWENIWGGFRCLAAHNTLPSDNCATAPFLVATYCVANLGYNVLIIVILKQGGSNLLWLCLTVMVPLASVFFAFPFVPAANRSVITPWTLVGLIVILAGLVIYRFWGAAVKLVRSCMSPKGGATVTHVGAYTVMDIPDGDGASLTGGSESPSFAATPMRGAGAMHVPRRKRPGGSAAPTA